MVQVVVPRFAGGALGGVCTLFHRRCHLSGFYDHDSAEPARPHGNMYDVPPYSMGAVT